MTPRQNLENIKSKLIVVLGMHRSGTSVATRALQVLGIELGEHFLPPDHRNEKGYWEDADIQALNIEMLGAVGRNWKNLAPISTRDVETMRKLGFHDRACALLARKIDGTALYGLKDPRITILLPFWEAVFAAGDYTVNYVLAIRNPMSVAQSLAKRDNLDNTHSHLLWLTHVIAGLNGRGVDGSAVIDYDRLVESPKRELNRLARGLDLEVDGEKLETYRSEFLDKGLRHTKFDLDDLLNDPACPAVVGDIYAHLLAVASGERKIDPEKTLAWTTDVERLKPLFRYIDRQSRQINNIQTPRSLGQFLYKVGRSIFRAFPFGR